MLFSPWYKSNGIYISFSKNCFENRSYYNMQRPQMTTGHQQTTTNDQKWPQTTSKRPQTTTNHQLKTTNHQQTTTNDQINLFRIPIIYFFRKLETRRSLTDVNKHRRLTSPCSLIYKCHYATNDILICIF